MGHRQEEVTCVTSIIIILSETDIKHVQCEERRSVEETPMLFFYTLLILHQSSTSFERQNKIQHQNFVILFTSAEVHLFWNEGFSWQSASDIIKYLVCKDDILA